MKKHWIYFKYVIRHKYFVMVECFKLGLYWRGIKHDWHKFLPSEWLPYKAGGMKKLELTALLLIFLTMAILCLLPVIFYEALIFLVAL